MKANLEREDGMRESWAWYLVPSQSRGNGHCAVRTTRRDGHCRKRLLGGRGHYKIFLRGPIHRKAHPESKATIIRFHKGRNWPETVCPGVVPDQAPELTQLSLSYLGMALIYKVVGRMDIEERPQLSLEQHGVELHKSTCTCIFFNRYTGKFFWALQHSEKTLRWTA